MHASALDYSADVLVVERDADSCEALRRVLEAEGCAVRFAFDADEALVELAVEGAPDVVVLDAALPTGRILDLCRRLRRRYAELSLVLICAADAIEDRVAGLRAGADDYVGKPFAPEEIGARVHVLLRRTDSARPRWAVLRHGTLRLDGRARQVHQGGDCLDLTKTEFDLLELFLRHPGRVLDRSFIYERVWGHTDEFSSNSLEVYVSSLRHKLERPARPRVIHTVRGVGYLFGDR
jgi:two-component system response regulator MprA